jgi:PAS domain S-box-containing protein
MKSIVFNSSFIIPHSSFDSMSLRTKLLSGYMMFVAALVVLGGWSAWHLREMGGVSRRIISNNYDSVVAAQDMKESLERQDSAALFALLGQRERAVTQLREHRARFDAAFTKAANNITEPGETEVIEFIRNDRDAYYRLFDAFLAGADSGERGTQGVGAGFGRDEYFAELEPRFNRLRANCDALLQLNQRAMLAKSEAAAGVARQWFLTTLVIAVSLVVAGLALAVFLSDRIVRPVRELTATTARIAGGDLGARAAVLSDDEIGVLAEEYNRMAASLQELRRTDLGELLVAQQTTEAAIDSLYDPLIVTDAEGCVVRLNNAAEEIFGAESENAGRHVREMASAGRIAFAVSEALSSQRPVAGEGALAVLPLSVDGAERAYRLRTTPMRDADSRLLGAVTLLEDITHLREIDRLKSEFISTASHELRTPLTSVQMGVHLLLEGAAGELTAKQQEILEVCREDCERLERLMRGLLDLSRVESGAEKPRPAAVRAADLIRDTTERLRPQVEFKGIALRVDVPPDAPHVLADREQIERVITNLITNAVRHTLRGGEIRINVAPRDTGMLAVSVSDTGRGIPTEYLPRIFDKFVQVPNSPSGGVGLGLAISERIIVAHGGQISAQSEVGRGSTFTFTLPVAGASASVAVTARRKQA